MYVHAYIHILTVDHESEVSCVLPTVSLVGHAGVRASITNGQSSVVTNLQHSSSVGVVPLSNVPVGDAHLCTIGEVPVDVHSRHPGATQDLDAPAKGVVLHSINTVAIDTKLCDVRDEVCERD